MSAKLTLNIKDKELIKEAKVFAKAQEKSLSALVENILKGLVQKPEKPNDRNELLGAFLSRRNNKGKQNDHQLSYLKEKYKL